jgi:FkbM family methyltransferase
MNFNRTVISSWLQEIKFAITHADNISDAMRLLAYTIHFHLSNRGLLNDKPALVSIDLSIGGRVRRLTLRVGQIGDLFVLYEILAFYAYRISPTLVAPDEVKTIVDCGANIGVSSLYFASIYPTARIYSVEADPESFAILKSNAMEEPRIFPIHGCIVATPEDTALFNAVGPAWGRSLASHGATSGGIEVPAITLDVLLEQSEISRVDLLKMDIEGAEREVLAKGGYLDKVQHIIAELHGDYGFSDFSAAVAVHGLRAQAPSVECKMITAHRPRSD